MDALLKNIRLFQRLKMQVSVSQESSLKSLKLADIYLQVMKSIYLILPNY